MSYAFFFFLNLDVTWTSETGFSSDRDWTDVFMTDEALKALNVSQIDLYYL